MGLVVGAMLPAAGASEDARRARLSLVTVFSAIVLVGSAIAAKKLSKGVSEPATAEHLIAEKKTGEALAQLRRLTAQAGLDYATTHGH
jgi:hypothetical protein